MRAHGCSGLTLIEVLIASTILFACITVVSETYRTSLISSSKAAETVSLVTPVFIIKSNISGALLANPQPVVTGDGVVLGVRYSFKASSLDFLAPPPRFDPDVGAFVSYKPRYRLYEVALLIQRNSVERRYRYEDIAWLPDLELAASP